MSANRRAPPVNVARSIRQRFILADDAESRSRRTLLLVALGTALQPLAGDFAVVVGRLVAASVAGDSTAAAGDQNGIAGAGIFQGKADSGRAVGNHLCPLR